jgi:hypothetical protein
MGRERKLKLRDRRSRIVSAQRVAKITKKVRVVRKHHKLLCLQMQLFQDRSRVMLAVQVQATHGVIDNYNA